jgi:hypothetical protein
MNIDLEQEKNIILSLNSLGNFLNTKYNNPKIQQEIIQMFNTILQNCILKNENSEDTEALNIILSFQHLKTQKEKEIAFQKLITICND